MVVIDLLIWVLQVTFCNLGVSSLFETPEEKEKQGIEPSSFCSAFCSAGITLLIFPQSYLVVGKILVNSRVEISWRFEVITPFLTSFSGGIFPLREYKGM